MTDHDLLIRLDEKVSTLLGAFEDLRASSEHSVAQLWEHKASQNEFAQLRSEFIACQGERPTHRAGLASAGVVADHEKRLRALEQWRWKVVGAAGLVQVILSMLVALIMRWR
jgi:hypothetical protein